MNARDRAAVFFGITAAEVDMLLNLRENCGAVDEMAARSGHSPAWVGSFLLNWDMIDQQVRREDAMSQRKEGNNG